MTTTLKAGSATHTGQVRSINEDSKLTVDQIRLYAVADGMGGHQGGEVASSMAVEALESAVSLPTQAGLIEAVEEANRAIHGRAADDADLRGMGTTMCAIAVVEAEDGGEEIAWVNVGDSRIYLFRDDELTQLSTDHSLVEDLRRDGQLTDAEAAVHPQRNIVTRALGIAGDVKVDSKTLIPFTGDRFVLSSDGMFNEVTKDQISATLRRLADPGEAADDLVRQANEHGGRDNITVVIVDVVDDGGRLAAADAARAADMARAKERAEAEAAAAAAEIGQDPTTQTLPTIAAGESADMAGFSTPAAAGRNDDDLHFGRDTNDVFADLDRAKGRHLTGRVLLFIVAVALVLGIAFGAVGWYAKRTYYVDYVGAGAAEQVAVYQGQPGGLLIFDPEVKVRTNVLRSSLTEAEDQAIAKQQTFGSLADARSYANNLKSRVDQRIAQQNTTTTAATTTTTTPKPTTTATPQTAGTAPATTAP